MDKPARPTAVFCCRTAEKYGIFLHACRTTKVAL